MGRHHHGNDIARDAHCDVTMGNDIPKDIHCDVTMGNDIPKDIHCDVTMSNDFAIYTYHGITMHNNVDMNLFYYVFSALYLIMIVVWVVYNKNKNKLIFYQSGLENTFVVFV